MPQASIAPKEATVAPATPTYSVAQQAWLNFVAKVRRGEQVDPTGQYVKDGTIMAADAEPRTRPKLSADRDQYPFWIRRDGTLVMLVKDAAGSTGSKEAPPHPPIEDCPQGCPGGPSMPPTVTSTFVESTGLGGSGDVADLKFFADANTYGYTILNADLNKGAGGSYIYYWFTRTPNFVLQGKEYDQDPTLSTTDPIVAYDTKTQSRVPGIFTPIPSPKQDFYDIWDPLYNFRPNTTWEQLDLNNNAGGKYIYSYQAKKLTVGGGAAPFHEVGILSGNSDQIQPPVGWVRWNQDLNEGAGGDYIYFCFKR